MPTSDAEGKHIVTEWYQKIAPKTVVDIGAGSGTYARLLRQGAPSDPGRFCTHDEPGCHRSDGVRWTAIEAWEPYIHEYGLNDLYDEVLLADVRRLHWPSFAADLVIAGDVLEHMTRADAQAVLKRIKFAAANLIVSVPVLHLPQNDVNGNPYERHIDHWTAQGMAAELGAGIRESWVGSVLGYWWWSREEGQA